MSSASLPPKHTQVLVIGGGPAGSYAAAVLAREGLDVTVFEAAKFPRYHVGESLVPSIRHYMRFIGAEEKLVNHGFVRKPGAAIKFNQVKKEGYTDFVALGQDNNAWNVVRSEFDELLLNHARTTGANVFELTRVKSLAFSPTDPFKPVSATWTHTPSSGTDSRVTGTTTFDYLVDASGRAGIISTTHLKNRHFNESLKNIAVWGYWKDVGTYGVGTEREGAPWFEALTDESGWAWFIPLHDGTTSVGIVMNQKAFNAKAKSADSTATPSLAARYRSYFSLVPGLLKLIGDGVLTSKVTSNDEKSEPLVRSATDFSYSADQYAGNGYRLIGDAGAFIDPLFSSGVHLALTSGLSAAATICAVIRGDCTEKEAGEWHTKRFATSYTRFQVVVLSSYKQILAQSTHVLSDIDEDNFDRAFGFLRPVLQGASDMGARLSENELQKSLDFCANVFTPTTPEQHERIAESGRISKTLLDMTAPVLDPAVMEEALRIQNGRTDFEVKTEDGSVTTQTVAEMETEAKVVLNKVNARRMINQEYSMNNFESEGLNGYAVRLAQGNLGLNKVKM
jgi:flavin-dependent dehydrogenase